MTQTKILRVT